MDEWYIHSNELDWDLLCNLRHYDIAYCGQNISKVNKWITMQSGTNSYGAIINHNKFMIKWKNKPDGFVRVFQEKNFKDKKIYKDLYDEREYLKFKDSIIEDKYFVERCNLWKSVITLNNFIDRITDEEKIIMKNLVNVEYN